MSRRSRKSKLGNFRSEFEKDVAKQLQPFGFSYEISCTSTEEDRTSLSAKDSFVQETRRSIDRCLSVSQRRKNSYLY
jgi:hypothetical protein